MHIFNFQNWMLFYIFPTFCSTKSMCYKIFDCFEFKKKYLSSKSTNEQLMFINTFYSWSFVKMYNVIHFYESLWKQKVFITCYESRKSFIKFFRRKLQKLESWNQTHALTFTALFSLHCFSQHVDIFGCNERIWR